MKKKLQNRNYKTKNYKFETTAITKPIFETCKRKNWRLTKKTTKN